MRRSGWLAAGLMLAAARLAWAGAGDVQTRTDHPWYPGELACSTFERLFKTQAELYTRVTGRAVDNDEDKVLASWLWRNTHYFHSTEGSSDLWGKGLGQGTDGTTREYWKGLFADGYSLCFATHHQWHGEMEQLLGHSRCRSCGVDGHTSFEVYLKGGAYGDGQWALLDHDISTVYFDNEGKRLLSLMEVSKNLKSLMGRKAEQNRGWLPAGLHPSDPGVYATYKNAQYATGYAAVPPMVHLRSGETLKRYLAPGLEDGKTFVYWGVNYAARGIPGPDRDRTWINHPEQMFKATRDASAGSPGGRYANAVYTYKPDFAGGKYKEAAIEDAADHVTLEFYTPYVIGGTPTNTAREKQVGQIYEAGASNGCTLSAKLACPVRVSADQGKTWTTLTSGEGTIDLTDAVKGRQQYWLKFEAPAKDLAKADVTIRTVCQASSSVIPRVQAGKNQVTYRAGGLACVSAGPDMNQVVAHVVDGQLGGTTPVTVELKTPRGEKAVRLFAVQRQSSGSPPKDIAYNIDYSTDGGQTWKPVVKDAKIVRHQPEPDDFWSQSHVWGDVALDDVTGPVRVRFNSSGRTLQRAEAHLVYKVENTSPVKVTYAWKEGAATKTAEHTYAAGASAEDASWSFEAGANPTTFAVEYAAQ